MAYSLVFRGELANGFTQQQVRASFATVFPHRDPHDLDACFNGGPTTLRHTPDEHRARQLQQAFARIGALCEVHDDGGAVISSAPPADAHHGAGAFDPSSLFDTMADIAPPRPADVYTRGSPAPADMSGAPGEMSLEEARQIIEDAPPGKIVCEQPRWRIVTDLTLIAIAGIWLFHSYPGTWPLYGKFLTVSPVILGFTIRLLDLTESLTVDRYYITRRTLLSQTVIVLSNITAVGYEKHEEIYTTDSGREVKVNRQDLRIHCGDCIYTWGQALPVAQKLEMIRLIKARVLLQKAEDAAHMVGTATAMANS